VPHRFKPTKVLLDWIVSQNLKTPTADPSNPCDKESICSVRRLPWWSCAVNFTSGFLVQIERMRSIRKMQDESMKQHEQRTKKKRIDFEICQSWDLKEVFGG